MKYKSAAQSVNTSFDRSAHMPFRIDPKGYNADETFKDFKKGGNQGVEEVRIPNWWQRGPKANANRTHTDMNLNRRRQLRPDLSFDLDGDGIVGNRDFVLAKLFDKDGDGKLNVAERAAADEAIRNVSNNYPS